MNPLYAQLILETLMARFALYSLCDSLRKLKATQSENRSKAIAWLEKHGISTSVERVRHSPTNLVGIL